MQVAVLPSIEEKAIAVNNISCLLRKQLSASLSPSFEETVSSYSSFIFVESGTALVSIGEKDFILESGSILFVPPSQFHLIKSADGLDVTYIFTSFETSSEIIKKIPSKPIKCNSSYYHYLATAIENAEFLLINSLDNEVIEYRDTYINKYNQAIQITYNCLEIFLLLLSSNIEIEPIKESHKQTRHTNITANVEIYLKERIRENISLLETAQHFGYSVSNIQKIFKAVTGQSIIVYFNKLKLEEAKRLISENNMTFSQISSYLSFSNPNYFSRIFKTTVGMTPTEYANLYQKEHSNQQNKHETKNKKSI